MKQFILTKQQIKAIRIVKGYNNDLRIDISTAVNKNDMWHFIDENIAGLLGIDIISCKYKDSIMTAEYENNINWLVDGVCSGEERRITFK